MKLDIRIYGDPILRTKGKRIAEVDQRIRQLADDMIETMHAANGVGLAAQQIGEALQLTVIDVTQVEDRPSTLKIDGRAVELDEAMPLILLNPEAELGREIVSGTEGCLSFPEISAEIDRPESVRVRAETLDGSPITLESTGLLARALQHEIDHLNGILFIDRMKSGVRAGLSGRLKRLQKEGEADRARAGRAPAGQRVL
jgi:peptide deformylase